jgi:hypothetical protein
MAQSDTDAHEGSLDGVTRRDFLRTIGAGTLGAAVLDAAPAPVEGATAHAGTLVPLVLTVKASRAIHA